MCLESVQNAVEQSKIVALAVLGDEQKYDSVPWFWSEQYDARLQIAGIKDDFDRRVILGSTEQSSFSVISLKENRVLCIESVNRPSDFIAGKKLIAAQTIIPKDINFRQKPKVLRKGNVTPQPQLLYAYNESPILKY